jgi:hypothetical protein
MSEQRRRKLANAVTDMETPFVGAGHYGRLQQEATSGEAEGAERAHPLAFDESGFPIAQPWPSFAKRVARLLSA